MRLGKGSSRQKPRTPSTEILSDGYSRAEPRSETRREVRIQNEEEDQESEEPSNPEYEEADNQGNKVSKKQKYKKNQRQ